MKPEIHTQRPWWQRRRTLLIAVATLIIIAIAVGVGVGVAVNRDDGQTPSSAEPTSSPDRPDKIWQPEVNTTWQIVLLNPLDISTDARSVTPDVAVFDIDLFINSAETISTLHRLGKRVICYFSAGSYEDWRPDSRDFREEDSGAELDGWPGERWLRLSSENVRNIMVKRVELAREKGCDAIDPDNVDGYQNENGLGLTARDSIDFMSFLADTAAKHKLSIGLKNAADIIPEVLSKTHFSVNEQCAQYSECDSFRPYIDDGKPVFHIEYPDSAPEISRTDLNNACTRPDNGQGADEFSTVLKNMDLDGFVEFCNGTTATTDTTTTTDS